MDLISHVRLARRYWFLLLPALLIGAVAAMVVTANTPPSYQASLTLLITGKEESKGNVYSELQAIGLSQQKVQSYANLLMSRRVVGQVLAKDGPGHGVAGVKAEAIPLTSLLRVTVVDGDPARAARLANDLATTFIHTVGEIEHPDRKGRSGVRVTVVDSAQPPAAPISPRPVRNLVVGMLLALIGAYGTLLLRERLDTRIRSLEQLHAVAGAPVLGVIPRERDAERNPLVVRQEGASSRAEAFRALRTNLQFLGVDRRPRALVVTSCLPEEGKTSTATNLAIVFAQAGWRVLLVDADLRRPRVPAYLGIEGAAGLTDVLIGEAALEDVVQPWGEGEPPVAVLPSGQVPANPSELLGSEAMRKLVTRLTAQYDMVIFDSSPLLPVTDAAALSAICDEVLLVCRMGMTRRGHLTRARELLDPVHARTVGTVLNFVPPKADERYGYSAGARYGYESDLSKEPMPAAGG
ncbi:chromosome partitioning protein [Sphaerisporangium rufum]|uniref:non-specific protein-tyrosine kinase n=1 Tax=Sphaerisporangium rufum TaxID=1381558 RepID=A0A919R2W4_9ACTN|nr:polysaccharide biosynthesis tyrosine autokinase [Sphaerisporangium rufum]GII78711.1 chromosome partitioning protein [Sphaerisporangium rufum]